MPIYNKYLTGSSGCMYSQDDIRDIFRYVNGILVATKGLQKTLEKAVIKKNLGT